MASWDEPPRFGRGGEAPPVRTDPVLLTHGFALRIAPASAIFGGVVQELLDEAKPHDADVEDARLWLHSNYTPRQLSILQAKALGSTAFEATKAYFNSFPLDITGAIMRRLAPRKAGGVRRAVTLLRLRTYSYWEREDPLTRLSVGATGKITRTIAVGLSTAASREITTSLGVEVGLPDGSGKVSGQQAVKDAITLTRTEQREDSRELTLPSPEAGTRRYAIWQRPCELHLDELTAQRDVLYWRSMLIETFNPAPAIVATSDAE